LGGGTRHGLRLTTAHSALHIVVAFLDLAARPWMAAAQVVVFQIAILAVAAAAGLAIPLSPSTTPVWVDVVLQLLLLIVVMTFTRGYQRPARAPGHRARVREPRSGVGGRTDGQDRRSAARPLGGVRDALVRRGPFELTQAMIRALWTPSDWMTISPSSDVRDRGGERGGGAVIVRGLPTRKCTRRIRSWTFR
jgi:hypothetical protein